MANQPGDTALFGGEGYIIEGAEGGGMRLAVEGVDDKLLEVGGAVLVDAEIHRNMAGFYQGDSPPCNLLSFYLRGAKLTSLSILVFIAATRGQ